MRLALSFAALSVLCGCSESQTSCDGVTKIEPPAKGTYQLQAEGAGPEEAALELNADGSATLRYFSSEGKEVVVTYRTR